MDKKKLMILDGNSLLYRAFFALPPLTTKDGVYTNGVYGFLTMYYKLIEKYNPDYVGVAFDPKKPTFRHKEYEEYKAGRAKTPDELLSQFPILKEVLDKLGVTRLEIDDYEADDVAGTLAKFGEKHDLEVIIVTGDKDYLQLASDNTTVLITKKGITNLVEYDKDGVIDRYQITPEQFVDMKGLMGDKSDNIPGVPGVGEKTAIKLLKQFDSIEGVYENISEVSGKKLKERLIENQQQALMSKRLAKIITNIPLDIELDELKKEVPDNDALIKMYKELEFNSLLKKVKGNSDTSKKIEQDVEVVVNKEKIEDIIKQVDRKKRLVLKFLVDGEYPLKDDILALGIKIDEDKSYYIDFEQLNLEETLRIFKEIIESNDIKKSGHNLKKDILVFLKHNIHMQGIYFDSMIGQYLIAPSQNKYSLKNLAYEYLTIDIKNEEEILGKGRKKKAFKELQLEERVEFLSNQLNVIYNIEQPIIEKIEVQNMYKLYNEVEIPLIEVLASMEYEGFKVDVDKLNELGEEFDKKIEGLTKSIYDLAGEEFNINSPKQLGKILFEKLELPVIKKTKTGYSTSAEVLEKLSGEHDIIEKILEYRQITKLKSTYVDGLMSVIDGNTGKVHSSFNQTITTTGRISSTEPNLQNIPIKTEEGRKIRKVFVPQSEEYKLVDADYSQIELRVLAHISDDEKLKEAFFTDEDIHTKTASEVFGVPKEEVTSIMRSRAKAVNFGIMYGISDYGLSRDLKISRKEAKQYIENYLSNYKKVKEYMSNVIKCGKEKGYVETILNRRRYLPELKSRNYNVRSFGERMAMNTPIQGSAADIIKIAMVNVYKELKTRNMESKLILQVHDELIIEAHKDELEEVKSLLKSLMEDAVELSVPLKADMNTGDSWYDTK
ncbi:DNA polymerase I [Caldisalinibacter kiritimatiensis]|uniref:DNA polymerase I n=1 Tax=Caldisalinibacter kiritimatiensis TaxID=1304284 RepID=R1ARS6_9FIRM|nr:DNA polymerase I [Caldisalinibacter kiritimatiensis]